MTNANGAILNNDWNKPLSLLTVSGCTPATFFAEYFEAKALSVLRNDADYFRGLLSLEGIDRFITARPSTYPNLFLVNAEREIKASEYTDQSDSIDVVRLYQLHAKGATIVLNQFHRAHVPLAELCAALELEFSAPFQANVYLTPPHAKGFKPHFDTHDVFILQLHGSKRWRLYGAPIALPLSGQSSEAMQDSPGPPCLEIDLHPGDTLYIPRGLVHDAPSLDETSLHATVGILSYTWTDLLLEAFANTVLSDATFRRALPHELLQPGFDRASARKTFRDLLARLAETADADAALDAFIHELINSRRPRLYGQMAQLQALNSITLDSVVTLRPSFAYALIEEPSAIRLQCYGNEISFPQSAANTVRYALSQRDFRIGDLPSELDEAGKLVLVRRLVREGVFVVIDDVNPHDPTSVAPSAACR
jgi:ribosomal protein L16 Arg81 hydroxylase